MPQLPAYIRSASYRSQSVNPIQPCRAQADQRSGSGNAANAGTHAAIDHARRQIVGDDDIVVRGALITLCIALVVRSMGVIPTPHAKL